MPVVNCDLLGYPPSTSNYNHLQTIPNSTNCITINSLKSPNLNSKANNVKSSTFSLNNSKLTPITSTNPTMSQISSNKQENINFIPNLKQLFENELLSMKVKGKTNLFNTIDYSTILTNIIQSSKKGNVTNQDFLSLDDKEIIKNSTATSNLILNNSFRHDNKLIKSNMSVKPNIKDPLSSLNRQVENLDKILMTSVTVASKLNKHSKSSDIKLSSLNSTNLQSEIVNQNNHHNIHLPPNILVYSSSISSKKQSHSLTPTTASSPELLTLKYQKETQECQNTKQQFVTPKKEYYLNNYNVEDKLLGMLNFIYKKNIYSSKKFLLFLQD